jgi:transcription elongation factor Elf1
MYSEDNNRTFICPVCGKSLIVSIAQFEWNTHIHCNECKQDIEIKSAIEKNQHKYVDLMK